MTLYYMEAKMRVTNGTQENRFNLGDVVFGVSNNDARHHIYRFVIDMIQLSSTGYVYFETRGDDRYGFYEENIFFNENDARKRAEAMILEWSISETSKLKGNVKILDHVNG